MNRNEMAVPRPTTIITIEARYHIKRMEENRGKLALERKERFKQMYIADKCHFDWRLEKGERSPCEYEFHTLCRSIILCVLMIRFVPNIWRV